MKKVGKTSRPFRYDLYKIPCNYKVQVMNRFKRLGLADRVPEKLWMELHNIVQEGVTNTKPKKKKCKKAEWLSEVALQITRERREAKGKRERERHTQLNGESQRIAKRDKKGLLSEKCKETEENNRMGKARDIFQWSCMDVRVGP